MTLSLSAHPALQRHPFTIGENQISDISKLSEYYLGKMVFIGKIGDLPLEVKQQVYDSIFEYDIIEKNTILTIELENIVGTNNPKVGKYVMLIQYYGIQDITNDDIHHIGPENKHKELFKFDDTDRAEFFFPYFSPQTETISRMQNIMNRAKDLLSKFSI